MRLTATLRKILQAYLVALSALALLSAVALFYAGGVEGELMNLVFLALVAATFLWLGTAFFVSRSDGDEEAAVSAGLMRMSGTGMRAWTMPQELPVELPPLRDEQDETTVGGRVALVLWCVGNAVLSFGLVALLYYHPIVTVESLGVAAVAVAAVLLVTH